MTTETADKKKANLIAQLAVRTGSETRYRLWTNRITHTEGVQHLAEAAGAYWLIDLITSWCTDPKIAQENLVVWKLTVNNDRSATLAADDGSGHPILQLNIPSTSFPLDEIKLYLTDDTLLLPSEY